MDGARWVQKEILEPRAGLADLRVYAVWFNMVESDARENWPKELLTDPRVTHFWDEARIVGRWFAPRTLTEEMQAALAPNSSGLGQQVLWDCYLVFGPESRWDDGPSGVRRWGRTILRTREHLRQEIDALAGAATGTP